MSSGLLKARGFDRINALVDTLVQILDDMGQGQDCCTCLATKAQARIAVEPFIRPDEKEFLMPLSEAQEIMRSVT